MPVLLDAVLAVPAPPQTPHHYVFALTALVTVVYMAMSFSRHTTPMQRLARLGGDRGAAIMPRLLAVMAFTAGALLLFSGSTPASPERLGWIEQWVPLTILELSHFFDNLVGVSLLILARGVERRLDASYHLTIAMLVAGIFLSILRAFDIEQAATLALMVLLFLPAQKYFHRKTSLVEERFTRSWVVAILLVVFGAIVLGFISYENLDFSTKALLRFGTHRQEGRFLRATVGVLAGLMVFALMRLLRPARPVIASPSAEDIATARKIAGAYPEAAVQLAFLGDKYLFFNEQRTGFIMYGVSGRSWVALGEPVAHISDVPDLLFKYIKMVEHHGGWPVFYKVGPTLLYLYLDYGLSVVKLGEEARVSLAEFSMDGPTRRNLRRVWRKIVDEGCTFELIPAEHVAPLLPELRAVSDAWLSEKKAREKGFSLGFFSDEYVRNYPVGIVRKAGRIVAFGNVWLAGNREELEIDLMRYTTEAPAGIMRYVIVEMMLWGQAHGYRWFNLGMAPLSGLAAHAGAPIWHQIGVAVRGAGERFYNFQGIREFKQWFYPEWSPRFLVSVGGAGRPIVLANIAALISGGLEGVVTK